MVNLLPQKKKDKLKRKYFLHLLASIFFLCAIVSCAGIALLTPSFFLARALSFESAREARTAEEASLISAEEKTRESMSRVRELVSLLEDSRDRFDVGVVLFEATSRAGEGINITRITVTQREGVAVTVSGVAENRGVLLSFLSALRESGKFEEVSVPVSQLASDADISFSLSALFPL